MSLIKAFRFHKSGGPEVLQYETVEIGAPSAGEVYLRQEAVGVNFIDIYHRTGLYPLTHPSGIGFEAAGIIEAVGQGVNGFKPGDRVAYGVGPIGAYAEARLITAEKIVKLPDEINFNQAAGAMLKGLTVDFLLRRTYQVKAGDTILIHAAAGGVGTIMCQWAKALGATVIGSVSSAKKAELAAANGCDHPINYNKEDLVARVREITGGEGVPVVYDSVGKDTFEKSLDCLRPLGLMVSFGNASGPVPPIDPAALVSRGSLFFTRPSLMAYVKNRDDLVAGSHELFKMLTTGKVSIKIGQTWPLAEAAEAQRELEAGRTTGSTILIP